VWLADHADEGPAGHARIAKDAQVPPTYLAKVLQALAKEEIVTSKRGVGGGYALNHEPDKLTVLDVVNAVDPIKRIRGCPLKLATHGRQLCGMHSRLDNAMKLVEEALQQSTIADILGEESRPKPMVDS
jgi:Rrf2 family protein